MPKVRKLDIVQRFTTRAQAERYRDRFGRGRHRRAHEREAKALKVLLGRLSDVEVVLDVGSGVGRFVPIFMKHCVRLIQTDFSKYMLDVSRDAYSGDFTTAEHIQSDARHLPFAEDSVDLVFCHRLLNHLPDPYERSWVMRNLARVSRRYVVFSCLGPPAALRSLRRMYERLKHVDSVDGHVAASSLAFDACECGLRLLYRTPIRSFPVLGEFFTFVK